MKHTINYVSLKWTIINTLIINKMKVKKSFVRFYRFKLDVVCRKFFLQKFEFCVPSRSLRSAWAIARDKSVISGFLAYLGYPDIVVQKVIFVSCAIYTRVDSSLTLVKIVDKVR